MLTRENVVSYLPLYKLSMQNIFKNKQNQNYNAIISACT